MHPVVAHGLAVAGTLVAGSHDAVGIVVVAAGAFAASVSVPSQYSNLHSGKIRISASGY